MNAKNHYDSHLGRIYSWMSGDFDENLARYTRYFHDHGITPRLNMIAFDLGCGHGLQSVALAKAGFEVTSVDFNRSLLDELSSRSLSMTIRIVEDDILHFLNASSGSAELIICMGDTLTHLSSLPDLDAFISAASKRLLSGGVIVLSYRDLTNELKDEQRFIHVRSDNKRILTCFLEYFETNVKVYDLLYESVEGKWIQKVSSYSKLRLCYNDVATRLAKNGVDIVSSETINGMIHLIGQRRE